MSLQAFHRQREADKRASIISAARRLFSANPFSDVTTATLAAEGGVSTATLYRYFTDKETLFDAVIDDFVEDIIESLKVTAIQHEDSLFALTLAYAQLLGDPEFVGIMRVVVADSGESANFKTRIEEAGNALFYSAFEREVQTRLPPYTDVQTIEQASIELSAVIESSTLLRGLLFNEFLSDDEITQVVERTLTSWRRNWLGLD